MVGLKMVNFMLLSQAESGSDDHLPNGSHEIAILSNWTVEDG
jgi:hypothetical protein